MKGNTPTKGVAPVFTGIPGALVDAVPEGVIFGERKMKTSPYDPLLLQLKAAGPGKFLKFDDLRARASLMVRAKKLAIKILFGEKGNALYVSLAKADLVADGVTEKQPTVTLADLILKAIAEAGRTTAGEIVSWARSNGAPGIGITQVDGVISNLARAGKIKLQPSRGGGADGPERWKLAA